MSEVYCFQINVREGAPGCADDDTYNSRAFTSFAAAYKEMVFFEVERYWPHLRMIQSMYIWKSDHPKVYVSQAGNIAITDIIKLGVTEDEYHDIIERVNHRL